MTYYSRDLPHWQPPGKDIFISWRLYGSLPVKFVRSLQSSTERTARERFRATEGELHKALHGPLWLKEPDVANCVVSAIRRGEKDLDCYRLEAFVVMPNHVHLLIEPRVPLAQITHRLKGASAHAANQILGRQGQHFWQNESFDHWVRNAAEFARIKNYIEQNPVKAALVKTAAEWLWSSAAK
jgi:REP element-mobilizing transposase RayT